MRLFGHVPPSEFADHDPEPDRGLLSRSGLQADSSPMAGGRGYKAWEFQPVAIHSEQE